MYNGKSPRSLWVKKNVRLLLQLPKSRIVFSSRTSTSFQGDNCNKYNLYYVTVQFYFLEFYFEVENCALLGYYAASRVNPYRCFVTTYRSHHQVSRIQGSLDSWNFRYSLHNRPEEHSSHLLRSGNFKSCVFEVVWKWLIDLSCLKYGALLEVNPKYPWERLEFFCIPIKLN